VSDRFPNFSGVYNSRRDSVSLTVIQPVVNSCVRELKLEVFSGVRCCGVRWVCVVLFGRPLFCSGLGVGYQMSCTRVSCLRYWYTSNLCVFYVFAAELVEAVEYTNVADYRTTY